MWQPLTWQNRCHWKEQITALSPGPSGGDSVEELLKIAGNNGNGNISDTL